MKKVIFKLFSIIAILLLMIQLASCKSISKDDAKANLENAGYTVTVMDGNEFADSDKNSFTIMSSELDYYLYAEKDSEKIHIFFFVTIEQADNNMSFIHYDLPSSGQINNVIYYGTKQAVKDAKI